MLSRGPVPVMWRLRWAGVAGAAPVLVLSPFPHSASQLALQRGGGAGKRHSTAAVTQAQAYAGAAVARTATGQFAPAINASKRRRTDGGLSGGGGAAGDDAEYPGLPAGMKRPSLQVGGGVTWQRKRFAAGCCDG